MSVGSIGITSAIGDLDGTFSISANPNVAPGSALAGKSPYLMIGVGELFRPLELLVFKSSQVFIGDENISIAPLSIDLRDPHSAELIFGQEGCEFNFADLIPEGDEIPAEVADLVNFAIPTFAPISAALEPIPLLCVPETSTSVLIGVGLVCVGIRRRRL